MDTIFKDIKIFYSSVRDTVLQFNDDEIINKCMEIDELINMCSSYTMRGQILTQAVKYPTQKVGVRISCGRCQPLAVR